MKENFRIFAKIHFHHPRGIVKGEERLLFEIISAEGAFSEVQPTYLGKVFWVSGVLLLEIMKICKNPMFDALVGTCALDVAG